MYTFFLKLDQFKKKILFLRYNNKNMFSKMINKNYNILNIDKIY